jgi:F-type H+-transporting ATPase subunit b
MLLVLNNILYKPMISFMDNRNNSLNNNEGAIKACEEAIVNNNNNYAEIIRNANIKAEKLIHSKQQEAMNKSEAKIQTAKDGLDGQYEEFLKDLSLAKDKLKSSIVANADDLSKSINNKLISL